MAESELVFDPSAPQQNEPQQLHVALDGLAGKVVGFIDNSKPNFNHLAADLTELLVNKYGVASVVARSKHTAGVPAPADLIEELAEKCDAVITGSGD